ncbi:MAG: hypothetical protein DMG31_17770 [Acidobacteria bacterium]|nr:MAG: hypothetical protein DMG31_17770 [Acidobacteriota bacterium]
MNIYRCASLTLVASALWLAAASFQAGDFSQGALGPASAEQKQRTKVAQGEYVILEQANGGAIGPFGEEIYNFHETWTLWRASSGNRGNQTGDGRHRYRKSSDGY